MNVPIIRPRIVETLAAVLSCGTISGKTQVQRERSTPRSLDKEKEITVAAARHSTTFRVPPPSRNAKSVKNQYHLEIVHYVEEYGQSENHVDS